MIAAALAFAVGGLFMKYSAGMTKWQPSAAFFILFCAGAAFQALAMKKAGMGVVYLFVLGLESIVAFLISVLILRESASAARIVAVALIATGIALLHR